MKRRSLLTLSAASMMLSSSALAQQSADIDGIKAASKAFYDTLTALDDGSAMAKVWHNVSYVTYVGPRSTSIIVGWEAQKKYWEEFNKAFSERHVFLVDSHVHANGNLAWEIDFEQGEAKMKDGAIRKVDWIVTNIYEKLDGRWLMVSHHVQPKPQ